MTASDKAKKIGFKSLAEVSRLAGCTTQHLRNIEKRTPKLFTLLLIGCAVKKLEVDSHV